MCGAPSTTCCVPSMMCCVPSMMCGAPSTVSLAASRTGPHRVRDRRGPRPAGMQKRNRRWPHLYRGYARRCRICLGTGLTPSRIFIGTGLTPVASAPGLGSLPHLRQDWAHPCHICTGTGLTPAHICAGSAARRPDPLASDRRAAPRPHVQRHAPRRRRHARCARAGCARHCRAVHAAVHVACHTARAASPGAAMPGRRFHTEVPTRRFHTEVSKASKTSARALVPTRDAPIPCRVGARAAARPAQPVRAVPAVTRRPRAAILGPRRRGAPDGAAAEPSCAALRCARSSLEHSRARRSGERDQ
jgi:hypothetical protein